MSTAEILEELPKLPPSDLELIYARAAELQLRAVFDEADAAFEKEGGVSLGEARRVLDSGQIRLGKSTPVLQTPSESELRGI